MSDALGLPPFLCEPIDRALREVAVETEEFSPRGFKDLASQITLSHGRTPALSSLALAIVASWVLDHGGRMSKTRADLIAMLAIRAARSETEMKDLLRFILLCMPNLVHVTVLRSVLNGYPNLMEAHLLVLLRTRNVKEARTRLAACQYLARTNEDREILHHVTELHPHRFPRS